MKVRNYKFLSLIFLGFSVCISTGLYFFPDNYTKNILAYAQFNQRINDSGQKQGMLTFPTLTPTPIPTPTVIYVPQPTIPESPRVHNCGICATDTMSGIQFISGCLFQTTNLFCSNADINVDGRVDAGDISACGMCNPNITPISKLESTATPTQAPTATSVPAVCGTSCSDNYLCNSGLVCVKDSSLRSTGMCSIPNATVLIRCGREQNYANCCTIPATPTSIPTAIPTSTPTSIKIKTPTPTPTKKISLCNPSVDDMIKTQTVGSIPIGYAARPREEPPVYEWYYLYPESITPEELLINAKEIFGELSAGNSNLEFRENISRLLKELKSNPGCPVRFTGYSPTVFIYGLVDTQLQFSVGHDLTYADPGLVNRGWHVQKIGNDMYINGVERNYLYYEYSPAYFTRPSAGWNIRKREFPQFVGKIAHILKLTAKEKERLLFELEHAGKEVLSENVFVGIISRQELDAKLPIIIQAKQPVFVERFHWYVGPVEGIVPEPDLHPVTRDHKLYILELGGAGYDTSMYK